MEDDTHIRLSLTVVIIHQVVLTLLITRVLPLLLSLPSHPHPSTLPLHQLHTPTVTLHYTSLERATNAAATLYRGRNLHSTT